MLSWTTVWRIIFSLCIINKRETSPKNKSYIRYVQCSRLSFYLSLSLVHFETTHIKCDVCCIFPHVYTSKNPSFVIFHQTIFVSLAVPLCRLTNSLCAWMDGYGSTWIEWECICVVLCCLPLPLLLLLLAHASVHVCVYQYGDCLSLSSIAEWERLTKPFVLLSLYVCLFPCHFLNTDWHCEIFRGRRIYTHRFCCCCKEQWCENKHSQMQSAVYCLVKRLRISMAMKWSMNLLYIWWFRIICSSNRAHFNYGTTFGHFSMWCTQIEAFSPFIPLIWLLYTDNSVEQASWICWILPMKAKNNWQFSYSMGEIENLREKFVISKQNWAIPIKIRVFCLKYSNNFEEFEEKWENKMRKRSSLNKNSKNYSKQKHSIGLNV